MGEAEQILNQEFSMSLFLENGHLRAAPHNTHRLSGGLFTERKTHLSPFVSIALVSHCKCLSFNVKETKGTFKAISASAS